MSWDEAVFENLSELEPNEQQQTAEFLKSLQERQEEQAGVSKGVKQKPDAARKLAKAQADRMAKKRRADEAGTAHAT